MSRRDSTDTISPTTEKASGLPWTDAAPTPAALPSPVAAMVMRPIIVTRPGMDEVEIKHDLDYGAGADPHLRMDVYRPKGAGEPLPAVLFIHGGPVPTAFQAKDWGMYQAWARLVAASGLAGVTMTYRMVLPGLETALADVQAAVRYLRAQSQALGIDGDRLGIIAFSGGGPLLASFIREAPAYVKCLVDFYGYLDVETSPDHMATEAPGILRAFSPVRQLTKAHAGAPLFIARAGADQFPPVLASIDRFAAEALKADYPFTLMNNPGAPHGFDVSEATPRSVEIIEAALAFLQRHLLDSRLR